MDVLDGDLKAVEASGFRQDDLCGKVAAEIFIDDAIICRKKKVRVFFSLWYLQRDGSSRQSKRTLWPFCTSSRCRRVGWGRGQNDWGSLAIELN